MNKHIKHHITDQMLMGYSAGTLPEAFNILVASHISLCDECRAQLASFDSIGGAILSEDSDAMATLDTGSLAAVMDRLEDCPSGATERAPSTRSKTVPVPLSDYIGDDLTGVKWRNIGMGVRQAILPTSAGATARLLHIPAGVAMPDHGHNGIEMTMVLQGAFQDEDGYFARGDVETADTNVNHTPVADIHEDCICLAVTDAPLRFKGLLLKIAQRFIRI
ncbi:ChrR family anti-sigma-E factor [Pseudosulfitobacter sp. DSM 107133]|uniref:ChrR family anti-sigma-E factor n=1 Tax=Pseudosulfitobacter sp. DSM 107133 TaxID=2883100 RepID=UPI000DF4AEFB|nr:ChrR family anti-sigma-E factor [Pseudosulfitobacter sp. DSM 107133]UOA25631.1 Anti-sigma-E factor ChrR [Pseudosulfitobacter sp. DSM 107133]